MMSMMMKLQLTGAAKRRRQQETGEVDKVYEIELEGNRKVFQKQRLHFDFGSP